jgi:disulfide bond formation protein DsbB
MIEYLNRISPIRVASTYIIISTWLIMGAFFMQIFFDIRPCELCLWQRIPHYVVMFGAVLLPLRFIRFTLILQGFAFFANLCLSAYHSGIERKWWQGFSGCTTSNIQDVSVEQLYTQLLNTAIVKCDEIPWSFMGLSLTNYNFLISLVLCISAIYFIRRYNVQAKSHFI